MPLAKRPTDKLRAIGINDLIVKRGLWGLYLYDPQMGRQTTRCYNSEREVIAAAKRGERPEEPILTPPAQV